MPALGATNFSIATIVRGLFRKRFFFLEEKRRSRGALPLSALGGGGGEQEEKALFCQMRSKKGDEGWFGKDFWGVYFT